MRRRFLSLIVIAFVGIGVVAGLTLFSNHFDPGSRYSSQRLDYMGVVYRNQSDIYAFNEGYSETDDCPWGFVHNGIDYFFNNGSEVLAATPGQISSINWREFDNESNPLNRYNVFIRIRFNATIELSYGFEPFTYVEGDQNRQLAMIYVKVGDWVDKGDVIARFFHVGSGAHIHFGVTIGNTWLNPEPFFGGADRIELLSLIHFYHPGWNISYPVL
jgi:hypothetical protein